MKYLKLVITIIIILVLVMLVNKNDPALSTKVVFDFGFDYRSSEISLYFLLPITFLLGVIITCLVGIRERFKSKKQLRILMKESKEKDKELNSLRNLPLISENVGSGDINNTDK